MCNPKKKEIMKVRLIDKFCPLLRAKSKCRKKGEEKWKEDQRYFQTAAKYRNNHSTIYWVLFEIYLDTRKMASIVNFYPIFVLLLLYFPVLFFFYISFTIFKNNDTNFNVLPYTIYTYINTEDTYWIKIKQNILYRSSSFVCT